MNSRRLRVRQRYGSQLSQLLLLRDHIREFNDWRRGGLCVALATLKLVLPSALTEKAVLSGPKSGRIVARGAPQRTGQDGQSPKKKPAVLRGL